VSGTKKAAHALGKCGLKLKRIDCCRASSQAMRPGDDFGSLAVFDFNADGLQAATNPELLKV
jgi:hypothetical protein